MKRAWLVSLFSIFALSACSGTTEENASNADETVVLENTSEEIETVEEVETPEEVETTEEAPAYEDESSEGETASRDLQRGDIEADRSAYDSDLRKAELLEEAEETTLGFEDVMRPVSEVTSYEHNTAIILELTENGNVMEQQFQGIVAEVRESDEIELASDFFDENYQIVGPYAYGNTDTEEVLVHENGEWVDYSSQFEVEDLINGLYSKIDSMLQEMSDLMQVLETDEYYILNYAGTDIEVFELYQEHFEVTFENANLTQLELGMLGFINKETEDLESVNLISTAPSREDSNQFVTIEIILNYSDYGAFDDRDILQPAN
ncbi:hypothetical protein ACFOU0_04375 [Salinicoccus sesuvii]|uniref:Lipoprotein n=1 Tax=Salinicoccus sesuvii TaxID=868281 RepID=A0ABV7N4K8_9STAP